MAYVATPKRPRGGLWNVVNVVFPEEPAQAAAGFSPAVAYPRVFSLLRTRVADPRRIAGAIAPEEAGVHSWSTNLPRDLSRYKYASVVYVPEKLVQQFRAGQSGVRRHLLDVVLHEQGHWKTLEDVPTLFRRALRKQGQGGEPNYAGGAALLLREILANRYALAKSGSFPETLENTSRWLATYLKSRPTSAEVAVGRDLWGRPQEELVAAARGVLENPREAAGRLLDFMRASSKTRNAVMQFLEKVTMPAGQAPRR